MTSAATPRALKRPLGSSRSRVRGFCASTSRSTSRLNAIAAVRAATAHTTISNNTASFGRDPLASHAPCSANGSAKIEWLNLTSEK
jgi:hypothetical protein